MEVDAGGDVVKLRKRDVDDLTPLPKTFCQLKNRFGSFRK